MMVAVAAVEAGRDANDDEEENRVNETLQKSANQ